MEAKAGANDTHPNNPRIIKEVSQLLTNPPPGIKATVKDNNFSHLYVEIDGPTETVYEGGKYNVEVYFPRDYPMVPPKCLFSTKIYHPNIDKLGRIDLDILRNDWSLALQISEVLKSLQVLMSSPNFDSYYDPDIGLHFQNDLEGAQMKAREWNFTYAGKQA
mgnify:CR=1 FL=1